MQTRNFAAAAIGCALALGACDQAPSQSEASTDDPAAFDAATMDRSNAEAVAADTVGSGQRCTIAEVALADAKTGVEPIGEVGDLELLANGDDLMCSEPAGLNGDCQIADGKTVVAIRGDKAFRITSNEPSTYLEYGPDRLECVAPPGPVTQKRS